MQAVRKRLFLVIIIVFVLITQSVILSYSGEKAAGQIKEIGIGRILLHNGIMILIESNTVVENEDGTAIPYSKLNIKDAIVVEGRGDGKTIRANKIKKMVH